MAWRIHDSVIRGQIDNRTKGRVHGCLWLRGLDQPIRLELKGNAHGDLAGCLLHFENPDPTVPLRTDVALHPLQRGTIGDLTASRKVRVLDVPSTEARAMSRRGEKPPEHWANSLYLEWFSEANGRVVVEGADWKLDISTPVWRLTAADEAQRAQDAAKGMTDFMQHLTDAVEAQRHEGPQELEEWDEFEWEKFFRESDARTQKYGELLDKYRDHPNAEEIIDKEMGWDEESRQRRLDEARARGEEVMSDEELDALRERVEAAPDDPLLPDPDSEGRDWIRTENGSVVHPLQHRCSESGLALWRACDQCGLARSEDPDLGELLDEFQITAAKLAGGLNGLAYGRNLHEGGFIVAYLKRALRHLHAAQAALERLAPRHLVPAPALGRARQELFEIREGIIDLMRRFRAKR